MQPLYHVIARRSWVITVASVEARQELITWKHCSSSNPEDPCRVLPTCLRQSLHVG